MLSQASQAFASLAALLLFMRLQLTAAAAHANPQYPLQSTQSGTPDRFSTFCACPAELRSSTGVRRDMCTCTRVTNVRRILLDLAMCELRQVNHGPPAVVHTAAAACSDAQWQRCSGQTAEVVVRVCADVVHQDVLKLHGDAYAFDGRGLLSTEVEPACTPSTQDGFDCSLSRLSGDVIVHYNPVATGGAPQA